MKASALFALVLSTCLTAAAARTETYEVPLQSAEGWQVLTFSGIQANQVSFGDGGLMISVNASASPVIYPLPGSVTVNEVSLQAEIDGYLELDGGNQGEKNFDDFVFRLGLVHAGEKRLNFLQRSIAPDWIKRLYALAPESAGISHIEFYNVYSDRQLAGKSRIHPRSDLMLENFIRARPADSNQISMRFKPESNKPVLAIWLSIDGDDTQSSYQVLLKNLRLRMN